MGHKGHYGQYSGNAKWSKVTDSNMGATKKDDKAHMIINMAIAMKK